MESTGEQKTEDYQLIFDRITQHIPQWKETLVSVDELTIRRLSGLSNACFRVQIKEGIKKTLEPKTLLYRRFEQDLTDKRIEQAIFETKSEDGTGPKLYF